MLVASLLVPVAQPAGAADAAETRAKLQDLRERIGDVRDQLAQDRQQRDRTSAKLAQQEQRIATVAGRIDRLDRRIGKTRRRLDELDDRQQRLQQALQTHRATLASQLRAAYRFGRQPALQLLLRQDNPARFARAMGYYGYFNRARLQAIARVRTLVQRLDGIARQTRATRSDLNKARADLDEQQDALREAQTKRRTALKKLRASIKAGGDRLAHLRERRQRLKKLLQKINSVLGEIPAAPLESEPFASQAHDLRWPLGGQLRERYGAQRASGRMQWQGIVIAASEGSAVHAVYYGRVVFADWLQGFGQLLIIDHLDGYMSLYGYNQRLLRTTGDWVKPGTVVARAGASGGQRQPGLYFEIRHQGQPVDPTDWLASR